MCRSRREVRQPQAAEPAEFAADFDGVLSADPVLPELEEPSEDVDDEDESGDEPLEALAGEAGVDESLPASLPGRLVDPLRDLPRASLRESLR
jgi:hypothetical protein